MSKKPAKPPEPEQKLDSSAALFKEYGPEWMLKCIIAERFPYKTAMGIVGSVVSTLLAIILCKVHIS